MDNVPHDPDRYEPTEQDWLEYRAWADEHAGKPEPPQDNYCPAHECEYHTDDCPACEAEWNQTWALGPDADPTTDWWYTDLLMQASHGHFDPHNGWRVEN